MRILSSATAEAPPTLQANGYCFACGAQHPHGLGLRFRPGDKGRVIADWLPTQSWQGYPGIVHGGIVATVLGEAMSKAMAAAGVLGLTCQLEVRLRRSIAPGEALTVRGWIVERRKRRIKLEAEILDAAGAERAHGWATFLVPADPAREL